MGEVYRARDTRLDRFVAVKILHARSLTMLPNDQINPVFLATVQATEEAVVNAMIVATTMTAMNGRSVVALPHDRLQDL